MLGITAISDQEPRNATVDAVDLSPCHIVDVVGDEQVLAVVVDVVLLDVEEDGLVTDPSSLQPEIVTAKANASMIVNFVFLIFFLF